MCLFGARRCGIVCVSRSYNYTSGNRAKRPARRRVVAIFSTSPLARRQMRDGFSRNPVAERRSSVLDRRSNGDAACLWTSAVRGACHAGAALTSRDTLRRRRGDALIRKHDASYECGNKRSPAALCLGMRAGPWGCITCVRGEPRCAIDVARSAITDSYRIARAADGDRHRPREWTVAGHETQPTAGIAAARKPIDVDKVASITDVWSNAVTSV